jgi:uncharacterized protein YbjQ (UPF0145 family)
MLVAKPTGALFTSANLNYQFAKEEIMWKVASSIEDLGEADKMYGVINYKKLQEDRFNNNKIITKIFCLVQNIKPFIEEYQLEHKIGKLTPANIRMLPISESTVRVLCGAMNNEPIPMQALAHPEAVLFEISDLVQKMIVHTDPHQSKYGKRFHRSRNDAVRDMNGSRTHPTTGRGVFLEGDDSSKIAISRGVCVQAGMSGSSATILNGMANLGLDISGADFMAGDLQRLIRGAHSYFSGAIPIDIMVDGNLMPWSVPENVGKKIIQATRKIVGQENPEFLNILKNVSQIQTHSFVEVANGMTTTAVEIREGGISPENRIKIYENNADKTLAELRSIKK